MSCNNTALTEILRHLSDGDWHSIFSIHERFRLSPLMILECLEFLEEHSSVEIRERKLRLKPIEDSTVMSELTKIYRGRNFTIENESEARYSSPKLAIGELYMPEIELLGSELIVVPELDG